MYRGLLSVRKNYSEQQFLKICESLLNITQTQIKTWLKWSHHFIIDQLISQTSAQHTCVFWRHNIDWIFYHTQCSRRVPPPPRVDHHVSCQSWKLHETFPTNRATESSLLLHMGSHVPHKMSPPPKCLRKRIVFTG